MYMYMYMYMYIYIYIIYISSHSLAATYQLNPIFDNIFACPEVPDEHGIEDIPHWKLGDVLGGHVLQPQLTRFYCRKILGK